MSQAKFIETIPLPSKKDISPAELGKPFNLAQFQSPDSITQAAQIQQALRLQLILKNDFDQINIIECLTRYRLPEPTRLADKLSKVTRHKNSDCPIQPC